MKITLNDTFNLMLNFLTTIIAEHLQRDILLSIFLNLFSYVSNNSFKVLVGISLLEARLYNSKQFQDLRGNGK